MRWNVATDAETRKAAKYSSIAANHIYVPIAIETFGGVVLEASVFFSAAGRRLRYVTHVPRDACACTFLTHQCCSAERQRSVRNWFSASLYSLWRSALHIIFALHSLLINKYSCVCWRMSIGVNCSLAGPSTSVAAECREVGVKVHGTLMQHRDSQKTALTALTAHSVVESLIVSATWCPNKGFI